jgi:hypothetical protein
MFTITYFEQFVTQKYFRSLTHSSDLLRSIKFLITNISMNGVCDGVGLLYYPLGGNG